MDVKKSFSKFSDLFLLAIAAALLSACSPKSYSTVFPESSTAQSDKCAAQSIRTRFLVTWADGRFSIEKASNADVFVENFLKPKLEKIKHVEFDKYIQLEKTALSADASTASTSDTWGQEITQISSVWNAGFEGDGIKVAVVDAAVDYSHPQLLTNFSRNEDGTVEGWDFFNNGPNPSQFVSQDNIHGTHVAGIIAADPTQGQMLGMAPKAKLIPVNFMDDNGGGSLGDAINGINYAVEHGAKIINASWGGGGCSDTLKATIGGLMSKGVLFVTAAGNGDDQGIGVDFDNQPSEYIYPAVFNLPGQITVAATASTDYMTRFSNRSSTLVHIAAPGKFILSTVPGGYGYLDGTSMATPFVSGAAAVLFGARPQATVAQIRQALLSGVDIDPTKALKVSTGGRLNVAKALAKLQELLPAAGQ